MPARGNSKGPLLGTCRVCGEKANSTDGRILVGTPDIVVLHNGRCWELFEQCWKELLARCLWLGEMNR